MSLHGGRRAGEALNENRGSCRFSIHRGPNTVPPWSHLEGLTGRYSSFRIESWRIARKVESHRT